MRSEKELQDVESTNVSQKTALGCMKRAMMLSKRETSNEVRKMMWEPKNEVWSEARAI